ncbi:MAG: peptidase T [Prolixibacteraceae bacterium]|jgi:tripeptide aminopeptidase|nr:peptidase T [Prolixibacteraceae bacterium]
MKQKVIDRFIRYIRVETTSDPKSGLHPSTPSQLDFSRKLAEELKQIGLSNVTVDDNAYVMATLPSNIEKTVPVVGFVAHVDTSPDFSGKNVNPLFVENYNGEKIVLNKELEIELDPKLFPELLNYKGQTLITTDGTTLLSADDKAGLAEIVTAMEYLIANPEIPHGEVKVGFTPDEEIGEGANYFDVEKFGAQFAYTMDGGEIGELEFENFNAAGAKIKINGRIVHPGFAKNKMKNSLLIAQQLLNMLPANEVPQHTDGFEGFYHLMEMNGKVEECNMEFIIRDHNRAIFEHRKEIIQGIVTQLNIQYGEGTVELDLKDQYYNMLEKIEPVKYIVDIAEQAMIDCGISPKIKAIRGGTDGARLSYMGLPCPNIFAGGHNFHGKYEFVPVESMQKAVEVILKIIERVQNVK